MTREELLKNAKPILLNTEMVRAILDRRKTVTRLVCKDGNDYTVPDMSFYDAKRRTYAVHNYADKEHEDKLSIAERVCPICPGDILYVRETWDKLEGWKLGDPAATSVYFYRADGDFRPVAWRGNWRPSIHMPKEAARIFLRVTDVRVERLQDITEEQAQKEGMPDSLGYPMDKIYCPVCNGSGFVGGYNSTSLGFEEEECQNCDTAVKRFKNLWNSTIKKSDLVRYGWDANPWVWVIEFERIKTNENTD